MDSVPGRGPAARRRAPLTERDREVLTFLAEHRLALEDHVQGLLGVAQSTARDRLRRLTRGGYASRRVIFHGHPPSFQVTSQGLAAIGSPLPRPRNADLREYLHDVGLGWLSLGAARGAFGPVAEVISERELRSRDGLPRVAGMPFGPGEDSSARQGVRLAGVGRGGREQLHYPDLVLRTADGRRIALELELTAKGRHRRERILAGYAAARNVDAVVYLVNRPGVARSVRASIARLGVADRVQVHTFAWTPRMTRLERHLSVGHAGGLGRAGEAAL